MKKKEKRASLIILKHSNNMRIITGIEDSGEQYIPGSEEEEISVKITPAPDELLKICLRELSLKIEDPATIRKVALKFSQELCSMKGKRNALAIDESTETFYTFKKCK